MHPSQDPSGQGGNFEDQVRNLFLSNGSTIPHSPSRNGPATLPGQNIPPRMVSGAMSNPQEIPGHFSQAPLQSPTLSSSPNSGHKRPNQAQRRQMNSQLSIPIDSRPVHGIQAGRGTFSPQMQGQWAGPPHPQIHQNQRYGNNHQQYSPRFQGSNNNSPYSPQSPYSPLPQASPRSPMPPVQPGSSHHFQPRSGPGSFQAQPQHHSYSRPSPQSRQLYQPGSNVGPRSRPPVYNSGEVSSQAAELEKLLLDCIPEVGITPQEEEEKENFRAVIEDVCRAAIAEYEAQELRNDKFDKSAVEVQCFGSMKTGFATKASDMDLALISPGSHPAPDSHDSSIPRLLERKLLDLGYGARLLTRTRVPIIKLCQNPTAKLLSLLRDERTKWESGFVAEVEDLQPDVDTPVVAENKETAAISVQNLPEKDDTQRTATESREIQLASLKQKEGQSLSDYYNLAKRLLRKIGGRDITPSAPDPTESECKILNEVCATFISGLLDTVLSTRLCNSLSISPLFDHSLPQLQRTLHGIWLQIEGEKLALGWDHREITEANEKLEAEVAESVNAWRTLQNKNGSIVESLHYNRQLSIASDKMRRAPTVRLVSLEQIPFEEPIYYYGRAQKILEQLQGHQTIPENTIVRTVTSHYVSGIVNTEFRETLQQKLQTSDHSPSLEQIGLHHRILQLAVDYEHAIAAGMYDEYEKIEVDQIQDYIKLLRNMDLQDTCLPKDREEAALIAKIRLLPDPTHLSTSKPRDRYQDHLEFPKSGVGIQCDINFSAQLALHNTLLLRCYSHCDPRVKPMILFVKHWAKLRGVNTPYRGTLSSYGYVLMVLHYLVNIASPFVLPNLQDIKKDPPPYLSPKEIEARTLCSGRDVRFWRNEMEIKDLATRKMLNHNHDSTGFLLRGFFEYYAQTGPMSTVSSRGFDWGREVLSLRTLGGVLTKQDKGWVGAKTVIETSTVVAPPTPSTAKPHEQLPIQEQSLPSEVPEVQTPKLPTKTVEETKEVRHRYLFAIEDPFELDHNVARTVTHNGIVSIRDEFRRAWRIIKGSKMRSDGTGLLDPIAKTDDAAETVALMDLIHGPQSRVSEPQS